MIFNGTYYWKVSNHNSLTVSLSDKNSTNLDETIIFHVESTKYFYQSMA